MSNSTTFVAVYTVLMLMSLTQHLYLQYHHHNNDLTADTPAEETRRRIRYQPPIPYNQVARFKFVGLSDVLCYHLMRFTPREVERILPLLSLYEIRFRNRLQATLEEALAVVLIRLSYPTRYWAMMDRFWA